MAKSRTVSHFVAAGIGDDERRYLIETAEHDFIPAVKRDGKFLNLVSMKYYVLDEFINTDESGDGMFTMCFIPKHDYDL